MSPDSSENELALHILFHELIVDKDMFGVEELLRCHHKSKSHCRTTLRGVDDHSTYL
ncbi:hypothetical protein Plhal304r1_c040g0117391 [Plasmopara halstedii]